MKDRPLRTTVSRLLPAAAAACALWLSAAALAAPDPKASRLYEDAQARFEKNDVAGAIIQLKNALQIDKQMLQAHLLLGKALVANGDMVAAEAALETALRLGVDRSEVVVLLARAVIEQAKPRALLEQPRFAEAGLPPPVRLKLLLLKARAAAETGDLKTGLQLIGDARAIEPRDASVWLAEVPLRTRAGQLREAAAAADRALALKPGDAETLYIRGTVSHGQGDLAAAAAYYDKAIAARPAHVEALVSRAGLLIDRSRLADAARDVAALRAVAPDDPRGAYLGALLAERNGNRDEVRIALGSVVALLDPAPLEMLRSKPQLLMLGGLAHYGLDQTEKAKPYLDALLRDQPGSPVAKLMARIHLQERNVERAIETLDGYLRRQPGDPQARLLLASALMSQGRHAKATTLLQESIRQADLPAYRSALGFSLMKAGKTDDAVPELEAAFRRDPAQIQAGTALASAYLQLGQRAKAVDVAELMNKRKPDQPGLLHLLGTARAAAGDAKGARQALEKAARLDAAFIAPHVELARLDLREGAVDRALARLGTVVARSEKHVETLMLLGQIHAGQGRLDEAQRWLEKAEHHSAPDDLQPASLLVEFHMANKQTEAMQAAMQRLAAKAPDTLPVALMQARVQLAMGERGAARTTLTRASGLAAYDPPALVHIAGMQLAAGHAAGAGHSLDKALAEAPGLLGASALKVAAEIELGEHASAEQRARQILAKHPKAAIGHVLLGDVALARGQRAAAVESYQRAHQIEQTSTSALRVFATIAQGDGAAAIRFGEQWLRSKPGDAAVRRAVADAHARGGNLKAARSAFETLVKQQPRDAEALNNLANVLLLSGDPGALAVADKALALKPTAPHIIGTAGWAAYKAGQHDRALQLLRDARLRNPSNAETRYFLGVALASAGRRSEAREELEAALQAGTPFASSRQAEDLLRSLR